MKTNYPRKRPTRRYRSKSRPQARRGSKKWLLAGICIVILGIIIYSMQKHSPQIPASVAQKKQPLPPSTQQHPEFDFYTVLPKMQVEVTRVKPPEIKAAPPKAVERFVLQIAAFKSFTEADRMRAQLIMLGFNPSIQKYIVEDQVWHRIYVGPYASREIALQQQQELQQNSISSRLGKLP